MSGRIVERRDHVFTTFFSLRAFIPSTFSCRWPSMNGPFFSERAIVSSYSSTRRKLTHCARRIFCGIRAPDPARGAKPGRTGKQIASLARSESSPRSRPIPACTAGTAPAGAGAAASSRSSRGLRRLGRVPRESSSAHARFAVVRPLVMRSSGCHQGALNYPPRRVHFYFLSENPAAPGHNLR